MSKLNLKFQIIKNCRCLALEIVNPICDFIEKYTTVSIERTVLHFLGINGVNSQGEPWVNFLVDNLKDSNFLGKGIALYFTNAIMHLGNIENLLSKIEKENFRISDIPLKDKEKIKAYALQEAEKGLNKIKIQKEKREILQKKYPSSPAPLIYVIVATGNIYEDIVQAKAAALQGADIIAVIRSTGQSLLDYVPVGITISGFGGTYATRENFALMRKALDEIIPQLGRYIYLVNYSSGLCMSEIAALASLERLDILLNDAMYGILFRDINMQRTFIDQYFSRLIIAYSGIIINTGEDNYLTTADAYEEAHTVLASQFINEQFALKAALKKEQIGLGHAFEIDPELEDGFLFEIAQAQMIREIFPHSPIKYMPPTKHIDGNIFKAYLMNGMFNLASILTNQSIHLLGILTEAIHTPFISDRYLAIENARYIMKNAKHLSEEISFLKNGKVQKRAHDVLLKALKLLKEIKRLGLMGAIKNKKFAQISRTKDSGKGKEGVILKEKDYFNPVLNLIKKELNLK